MLKGMIKVLQIILAFNSILLFGQIQEKIPWPTLADSPWPMMKHDPQATGRSPYVGPKTPTIIWTMDMPYGIYSGPAIGPDNNLYFGTFTWLPSQSNNYFYSAYPNGTLRWTFSTGSSYATDSGFLIASNDVVHFASIDHNLYSVDLNGDLQWIYTASNAIEQNLMNIDLNGNIYFSSIDGYLYSVSGNGELNWKINMGGGFLSRSVVFSPDGKTIYVCPEDGDLYALNPDGTIKWIYEVGPVRAVPLVDNQGNIYITPNGSPAQVHSIKPDGTVNWIYSNLIGGSTARFSSPTMDSEGNIYFSHWFPPLHTSALVSIDYYGNFRWRYIFDIPQEVITQPLVCDANGTIYCGSSEGYFYYAISKEGELLWKLPLNGYYVDNSTAIGSDGTLYIATHLSSTTTGQKKTLIAVRDTGTTIVEHTVDLITYELNQNYPNPFNPTTKIDYSIKENGHVTLKVYDLLGREVAELVNENKPAGNYTVEFNATNLPSGVYIYKLTAGKFTAVKKLMLMK